MKSQLHPRAFTWTIRQAARPCLAMSSGESTEASWWVAVGTTRLRTISTLSAGARFNWMHEASVGALPTIAALLVSAAAAEAAVHSPRVLSPHSADTYSMKTFAQFQRWRDLSGDSKVVKLQLAGPSGARVAEANR